MKKIFLISFLLNSCFFLYGQNFQLRIDGKVNFYREDAHRYLSTSENHVLSPLNDSMSLRHITILTTSQSRIYEPQPGYSLNARTQFKLSKKLVLFTGIGINWFNFKSSSMINDSHSEVIRTDTIHNATIINAFNDCDRFENSISDFGIIDRSVQQQAIHLSIPLELRLVLKPNKLSVQAGLFLQTPIYARNKQEYLRINKEETSTETVCHYEKIVENKKAGNSFAYLQMGLSGEIEFMLTPKLGFIVGARENLTNLFSVESSQISPHGSEHFRPFDVNVGIAYWLGK